MGAFEHTHEYLYICEVTPSIETKWQTDVRSSKNTTHSGKAKADNTVKQTRVGRNMHIPARFMQLVHAVVAPNDIYTAGPAARIAIIN